LDDVDTVHAAASRTGAIRGLIALARPRQWAKSAFVWIGPFYGLSDIHGSRIAAGANVALATVAIGCVASAGYVLNDVLDADVDRHHPRKRLRPVASGAVSQGQASVFAGLLVAIAIASLAASPANVRGWVALTVLVYAVNAAFYSVSAKHVVILDVMSLALGYVLRVLAGCAAVGVVPTTWLLNSSFFLAMFLALGKRLGERRSLGGDAAVARRVQAVYTDQLLQMLVVVTGVATLLGYAAYVETQNVFYNYGFNLLWLTILPATYGLFRSIVLLDRGAFDDVTEMAVEDRPFQLASAFFVAITAVLLVGFRL
jgi:4-hydroxybenzoate polyprenyltransferase